MSTQNDERLINQRSIGFSFEFIYDFTIDRTRIRMKKNTITWMAAGLIAAFVAPTIYADSHISSELNGNYNYGEKLAQKAYGRGCLGCHSIDKFKRSNAAEMMERILESWHISSFTEEDLRDLSVYLSTTANQE